MEKLKQLKESGAITDTEFQIEKSKILNDNTNENKNTGKTPKKSKGKIILGIIAVVVLVIIFASGGSSNVGSSSNQTISIVKDGYLEGYKQATLGKAIDNYLGSPKWESIVAEDGNTYVNVSGEGTYYEKPVTFAIQYKVDTKNQTFEYNAMEMNGVPQEYVIYWALIENMFEEL